MADLSGRVALVSGGGRGIGAAIARELAASGARVVIADNGTDVDGTGAEPDVAEALAREVGGAAFAESIASPGAARQAVGLAVDRFGGLDILVNNAAILRDAFVFKAEPRDWEAVLRTNLSAAFYLTNAATPVMRAQASGQRGGAPYGWGRIVNIVSTAGLYGNYGQAAYASAKAGLVGLTRVTALDMARSRVTSNAVAPFAATRVTERIKPANDAQAAYKERALKVSAEHVARFIGFLCSAAARDITGQLFGVRGREAFVFSQPRPVARIAWEVGTWPVEDLARAVDIDLKPHFADALTDLEAFSDEPLV